MIELNGNSLSKRIVSSALILLSGASYAQNDCTQEYNCSAQLGWYIGADIGNTKTSVDSSDLQRFYDLSGLTADVVTSDNKDTGWRGFFGYAFNQNIALEAGYIDLGERSVAFTGETTDLDAFFNNIEHIYPQSADGLSLNVVLSLPLSDNWKISGKLGLFDWEGEYQTFSRGVLVGGDSYSGTDLWYGVEASYAFSEHWQAYIAANQFQLSRDDVNAYSLGIRYFWGQSEKRRETTTPKPTAATTMSKPTSDIKDTDGDGVQDNVDSCPSTPGNHRVNNSGCTVWQELSFSHKTTIYFAHDNYGIEGNYQSDILQLANFINEHHVQEVVIEGHTSAKGSESYNMSLSRKRAEQLKIALLEEHNVNADIKVIPKGESKLLCFSESPECDQQNRRVTVDLALNKKVPEEL